MTMIEYQNDEKCFRICMHGHAGFAPEGKDIVCAALSVLASELMIACEQASRKGEIRAYACTAHSGDVKLRFEYGKSGSMREIISLILQCLQSIAEAYGSHVKMRRNSNALSNTKRV